MSGFALDQWARLIAYPLLVTLFAGIALQARAGRPLFVALSLYFALLGINNIITYLLHQETLGRQIVATVGTPAIWFIVAAALYLRWRTDKL